MIRTTVQSALAHTVEGYSVNGVLTGHTIYLIRDKDLVFYIGQSFDPVNRFAQHIGAYGHQHGSSGMGFFIRENMPESNQWGFELWKPEECLGYVEEYYKQVLPAQAAYFLDDFRKTFDKEEAEYSLIWHFKPCFNIKGNPRPTPLPECYKGSW